jgi:AhpD family alkylhydroperoxidase
MSRLAIPSRDDVPEASKPVLDAVQKQLGVVPNMFRLMASSPATLQGFAANNTALGKVLDIKTRERIALAVAQVNGCNYCLSAHSYLGLNLAKLSPEEIRLNRKGSSGDAKANAAVQFAAKVAQARRDRRRGGGECVHQSAQRRGGHRHRLPSRTRGGSGLTSRSGLVGLFWPPAHASRRPTMSYGFLHIALAPIVRAA